MTIPNSKVQIVKKASVKREIGGVKIHTKNGKIIVSSYDEKSKRQEDKEFKRSNMKFDFGDEVAVE